MERESHILKKEMQELPKMPRELIERFTKETLPVGLLLKKVPSLVGTPSLEFQESWDNVLESAQSQLL